MKPTLSGRRIVTKFTSVNFVPKFQNIVLKVSKSVAETELVKKKIDESVAEAYAAVDDVNVDEEVGPAGLKTVFVDVGKKFVDIKKKMNTR